jgi:hypothetical protein
MNRYFFGIGVVFTCSGLGCAAASQARTLVPVASTGVAVPQSEAAPLEAAPPGAAPQTCSLQPIEQSVFINSHLRASDGGALSIGHAMTTSGSPDAPPVRANLSKDAIRTVITQNIDSVAACYEHETAAHPGHEGKMNVHFLIGPSGDVEHTALASNETGLVNLPCCVLDALKTWVFPAPEGGGVAIVTYPFVFREAEPSAEPTPKQAE